MFKNLHVEINIPKPVVGPTEYVKYGVGDGASFQGIKYTDFIQDAESDDTAIHELWNLIPLGKRKHFQLSLMSINRDILPHTDSNVRTVINFYLKTGGYVTTFCKPMCGAQSFQLPTQTNGFVYDFNDVMPQGSFVAKDGEVYILDVTRLHCVHSGKGARVALNLGTDLSYAEVLDMMSEVVS
jgi:hypothetical protein